MARRRQGPAGWVALIDELQQSGTAVHLTHTGVDSPTANLQDLAQEMSSRRVVLGQHADLEDDIHHPAARAERDAKSRRLRRLLPRGD